jgi:hypothetical protein
LAADVLITLQAHGWGNPKQGDKLMATKKATKKLKKAKKLASTKTLTRHYPNNPI